MLKRDIEQQSGSAASNQIQAIWSGVWRSQQELAGAAFFGHPLFLSGYRAMRKYMRGVDGKVLEAGGGPGRYGISCALNNPSSAVCVVDISPDSIDLGKRLALECGASNVEFQVADIMSLPFDDNTYDWVISDAVIQVFENHVDAVSEMTRVLKPGGTIMISVCNFWNVHTMYKWLLSVAGKRYQYGYEKSFTHRELANALINSGLRVVAADGFAPGYGAARLRLLPFRMLGGLIDLLAFVGDKFLGGRISKTFGFEILIVAIKPGPHDAAGI